MHAQCYLTTGAASLCRGSLQRIESEMSLDVDATDSGATMTPNTSILDQTFGEHNKLTSEEIRDLLVSVMFVLKHVDNSKSKQMGTTDDTHVCLLLGPGWVHTWGICLLVVGTRWVHTWGICLLVVRARWVHTWVYVCFLLGPGGYCLHTWVCVCYRQYVYSYVRACSKHSHLQCVHM